MDVRALDGGLLQQERRRPYDMVELATLESRRCKLLYLEARQATMMDPDTFEQFEVRLTTLR
jgi:translation elongation factor P/translation initiation factor 5A